MKTFLIAIVVIIIIGIGAYFLIPILFSVEPKQDVVTDTIQLQKDDQSLATTTTITPKDGIESILGKSTGGRDISVYKFGNGTTKILFVGGIHGGYAWNTALLSYETIDYLKANPDIIPTNVEVTIIPVLNPDGLSKVTGDSAISELTNNPPVLADTVIGRFNGNNVDLNRNFDCDWQASATWQNKTVSGGSEAFSELESQTIKNYIEAENPTAVIVWYSSAGGVYSSSCHNGVLEETNTLTNIYAEASGYPAYKEFDFYEITGDMVNWLAKEGTPAISVLLTDHNNTEWDKNQAGIEAILNYYSE